MEISHAHVDKVVTEFELTAVEKIVDEFRDVIHSSKVDVNKAHQLFINIKIALTKFQLIPPFTLEIPITKKQLSLARESLELGCFLSIEQKNVKSFEREYSKLKVFYLEYSNLLDESKQKQLLIGLHLCALLANNQIDEFHTELELITAQNSPTVTGGSLSNNNNSMHLEPLKLERKESLTDTLYSSAFIRYPVMLEQHLMEGSYNKIFAARAAMPSKYFSIFLDILSQTVRQKIAECSERAYPYYPLKDAAKLLLFDKESDVLAFAAERQWTIDQTVGRILFNAEAKNTTLQTHQTIKQMFDYANELERII